MSIGGVEVADHVEVEARVAVDERELLDVGERGHDVAVDREDDPAGQLRLAGAGVVGRGVFEEHRVGGAVGQRQFQAVVAASPNKAAAAERSVLRT